VRVQGLSCVVEGKNSFSEFWDCFLCLHISVWSCVVVLQENFSNIAMSSNSPEKLLQDFKCLNVQIRVNSLTS
jgi:hypothetical protein